MPWMTPAAVFGATVGSVLQFGHGTDAVDDNVAHAVYVPACGALQFGHGTDAVDDHGRHSREHPWQTCFNSATALMPWMTESTHTI